MGKKGQVTMFIILGIVIVAAVASIFVFKDYLIKNEFEREAAKLDLGEEAVPVYNYFKDCIADIAFDGIDIMASQGGYLEIPDYNYPIDPALPFSNKLEVFGNSGLEVPYWFYETSNGIQELQIPTVDEMESSLNIYIENNVFECTNNFTLFEEYSVRGFDNLDVITNIEDDKVYIKAVTELTLDNKGVEQKIENVYAVLDTDFGRLYNEANNIFDELYHSNFTEEKTIDMLVLYDELPFSFTEFSCERKIWSKKKVIEDFKKILELNTFKYGSKENKYFSIDADYESEVSFSYNREWPTDIEVVDEEEILKGNEITGNSLAGSFLRSVLCVNDYKFIYNVKYPVMVKLSSDVDFIFAYQTLIKHNQAKNNLVQGTLKAQESQLCLNKIMPTQVNTNVGNAEINFKCFDTTCDIGFTDSSGYLFDNFPQCMNGLIIAQKDGYKKAELLTSTNRETQNILLLDKISSINFEIRIIENGVERGILDDEDAIILLKQEDYSTSLEKGSEAVELAEGIYEVSSIITKNKKINIPKQNIRECTSVPKPGLLGLIFNEERCIDIDIGGFDLDAVVIGGNNFEFDFNPDDSKSSITFYINVYGIPDNNEEIQDIFDKIEGGSLIKDFRYPKYE
ncbi:hypothetical protein J4425_00980 [Candidatus Woesearchaeota archaeon]|nr:hypothetical protein [Candidatus Woesearchaeota archaeon]